MTTLIPAWGAILGLAIAIVLILRKFSPAYSLVIGAFIGGAVSVWDVGLVVNEMVSGVKDLSPAILRVLTAGILAGALIKTHAATRIALTITQKLGANNALLALICATLILTVSGVFIDVAVLTVAPIALEVARKSSLGGMTTLLALIGGGKSGNIISPNPNTIAAASNYGVPDSLSSVMAVNIPAAIVGIVATLIIVKYMPFKEPPLADVEEKLYDEKDLPKFRAAILGPVVAIALLFLRPVTGFAIDPMIALPVGGFVCGVATGNFRHFKDHAQYGLEKMMGVCVLLIGTGTIAGIIKASTLKDVLLKSLDYMGISDVYIAPISGILMSGATASTTAGATIASATFAGAVKAAGVSAVWGAALTNVGATVLDHLPHGSFFHVTGGAVEMKISNRLKLIPYETLIGGIMTGTATFAYHISLIL